MNGLAIPREKYTETFQMMGLNIANPRFLIQQGKIIQVVSMKPTEVSVITIQEKIVYILLLCLDSIAFRRGGWSIHFRNEKED